MESDSENEGERTMTMRGLRIINSQSNPIDLDNYEATCSAGSITVTEANTIDFEKIDS